MWHYIFLGGLGKDFVCNQSSVMVNLFKLRNNFTGSYSTLNYYELNLLRMKGEFSELLTINKNRFL